MVRIKKRAKTTRIQARVLEKQLTAQGAPKEHASLLRSQEEIVPDMLRLFSPRRREDGGRRKGETRKSLNSQGGRKDEGNELMSLCMGRCMGE